jgi:hypothetical protein
LNLRKLAYLRVWLEKVQFYGLLVLGRQMLLVHGPHLEKWAAHGIGVRKPDGKRW